QRRETLVERGQQVRLVLVEDPEVGVPVLPLLLEVVDVDERHPGLDQPAREQEVLAAHLPGLAQLRAVAAAPALADRRRRGAEARALAGARTLRRDVQRRADPRGFQ